jgi:hypothetical protein
VRNLLTTILLTCQLASAYALEPSNEDLWDVSQGYTNYHNFYHKDVDDLGWYTTPATKASRAVNMFGGTGGAKIFEPDYLDDTVFPSFHIRNERDLLEGAVVSVSWDLDVPMHLTKVNLFAEHSLFDDKNRFRWIKLYYDEYHTGNNQLFYELDATYPYADAVGIGVQASEALNQLSVSIDTDVKARRFLMEVSYANDNIFPADNGPIINEIDGFGTLLNKLGDITLDDRVDTDDIDAMIYGVTYDQFNPIYDLDENAYATYNDLVWMLDNVFNTEVGDADLDGLIGLTDFSTLKANFGKEVGWAGGNFTATPTVDLVDFSLLKMHYGLTPARVVPEPSCLTLALVALTLSLFFRKYRRY